MTREEIKTRITEFRVKADEIEIFLYKHRTEGTNKLNPDLITKYEALAEEYRTLAKWYEELL